MTYVSLFIFLEVSPQSILNIKHILFHGHCSYSNSLSRQCTACTNILMWYLVSASTGQRLTLVKTELLVICYTKWLNLLISQIVVPVWTQIIWHYILFKKKHHSDSQCLNQPVCSKSTKIRWYGIITIHVEHTLLIVKNVRCRHVNNLFDQFLPFWHWVANSTGDSF